MVNFLHQIDGVAICSRLNPLLVLCHQKGIEMNIITLPYNILISPVNHLTTLNDLFTKFDSFLPVPCVEDL